MLLNDNKGSFGMFSRAGRNSAEKYHILVRKDEILSGLNKKIKLKNLYSPDEIKHTEDNDDEIDIFATENNKRERKDLKQYEEKTKKKNKKNKKAKPKSEVTKYLELKKQNKKKMEMPSCTKYNPNNNFIWKRTIVPPIWDKTIRKNFSAQPKDTTEPKFYLSHSEWKVCGKNFVDLARQTRRASFTSNTNIRIAALKSAHSEERTLSPKKSTNNDFFNNTKGTHMNETNRNSQKRLSINNAAEYFKTGTSDENTKDSIDNLYAESKGFNQARKTIKSKKGKLLMNNTIANPSNRWVKIQAPDFKKIISREQMERIHGDKKTVIPFSLPNFNQTTASITFIYF